MTTAISLYVRITKSLDIPIRIPMITAVSFNLSNAIGGSFYALKDRFANIGQYMSMNTSKFGYVISYGFAALEVVHLTCSIFAEDYLGRANQRGYKLY